MSWSVTVDGTQDEATQKLAAAEPVRDQSARARPDADGVLSRQEGVCLNLRASRWRGRRQRDDHGHDDGMRMLRGTVYLVVDLGSEWRIDRTILELDVDSVAAFRLAAEKSYVLPPSELGAVLKSGPIGPPWGSAKVG